MSLAPFGPGRAWLAIRSNDRAALRAAIGFERLEETSFADGLSRVGRDRAFVTPALDEWTLVVVDLRDPAELAALAERVSRTLGEVQAFVCRGSARHFAWLRARGGTIERAFEARRGTVVRDDGDRQRGEPASFDAIDESTLLEVAGSWSVDPSTLALRSKHADSDGHIGVLPGSDEAGPRWSDVLGGVVGSLALLLIEIAAILALGRLFGRTDQWWIGVVLGIGLLVATSVPRFPAKLKRPALLVGVAIALGAVLGGAFPFRPG